MGLKGLLENGFKFGKNCLPPMETKIKKQRRKKKNFFLTSILPVRHLFFELFLLASSVNLFEVYCKKRKKLKKKTFSYQKWRRKAQWLYLPWWLYLPRQLYMYVCM
jgi:hypothetical protein